MGSDVSIRKDAWVFLWKGRKICLIPYYKFVSYMFDNYPVYQNIWDIGTRRGKSSIIVTFFFISTEPMCT